MDSLCQLLFLVLLPPPPPQPPLSPMILNLSSPWFGTVLIVLFCVRILIDDIVAMIREFPKIRDTLCWGPYNKDPTM